MNDEESSNKWITTRTTSVSWDRQVRFRVHGTTAMTRSESRNRAVVMYRMEPMRGASAPSDGTGCCLASPGCIAREQWTQPGSLSHQTRRNQPAQAHEQDDAYQRVKGEEEDTNHDEARLWSIVACCSWRIAVARSCGMHHLTAIDYTLS